MHKITNIKQKDEFEGYLTFLMNTFDTDILSFKYIGLQKKDSKYKAAKNKWTLGASIYKVIYKKDRQGTKSSKLSLSNILNNVTYPLKDNSDYIDKKSFIENKELSFGKEALMIQGNNNVVNISNSEKPSSSAKKHSSKKVLDRTDEDETVEAFYLNFFKPKSKEDLDAIENYNKDIDFMPTIKFGITEGLKKGLDERFISSIKQFQKSHDIFDQCFIFTKYAKEIENVIKDKIESRLQILKKGDINVSFSNPKYIHPVLDPKGYTELVKLDFLTEIYEIVLAYLIKDKSISSVERFNFEQVIIRNLNKD